MKDIKDLQEALEILKDPNSSEKSIAYKILRDFAEGVLKWQGIMPEKYTFEGIITEQDRGYRNGFNDGIDDCIKAMAGRISAEKIEEMFTVYFKNLIFEEWECGYKYNFYDDFKSAENNSSLLVRDGKNIHTDTIVKELARAVYQLWEKGE